MFAKWCRCDTCKCADNIIGPHNLHCETIEGGAVLHAIDDLKYKNSEMFDRLAGPHGYAVYRAMLAQGHPTALRLEHYIQKATEEAEHETASE